MNRCLGSVTSSHHPADIVLIDNGSIDGTKGFVTENYPHVVTFFNEQNLGFGGANNIGMKYAVKMGYDYLFLLNQDAWVEASTIGTLVSKMQKGQDFGILSPVHLNGSSSALDTLFEYYMKKNGITGLFNDYKVNHRQISIYEVSFVNAAAWMISREACLSVGLFHPLFFHYGEDNNYLNRLFFIGYKLGVVTGTYIFHDRDDRGYNHLKDSPKNKFKKELLNKMLSPFERRERGLVLFAIKVGFAQMRILPFSQKFRFASWAIKNYGVIQNQVNNFDNERLSLMSDSNKLD